MPKADATHFHAKFRLPDKGRALKGWVVGYVVWLGSMKVVDLMTHARCVCLVPPCGQVGYRTQVPQRPIET